MVNKRNRIVAIKEYIESCGVKVNLGKNKAQGNRGFFKTNNKDYRIDIAKGLSEENIISTLVHEFSHYIHYKYDKKLSSLNFLFKNFNDDLLEEMIEVTVHSIPKSSIQPLFKAKENINNEIKDIAKKISKSYTDFKISTGSKSLDKSLSKKYPYNLLLKHDNVKIINFFSSELYSITTLKLNKDITEVELEYIMLKSKQRALKRINSKINKYNRYYNSPSELLARTIELYATDKECLKLKANTLFNELESAINENIVPELTELSKILENKS